MRSKERLKAVCKGTLCSSGSPNQSIHKQEWGSAKVCGSWYLRIWGRAGRACKSHSHSPVNLECKRCRFGLVICQTIAGPRARTAQLRDRPIGCQPEQHPLPSSPEKGDGKGINLCHFVYAIPLGFITYDLVKPFVLSCLYLCELSRLFYFFGLACPPAIHHAGRTNKHCCFEGRGKGEPICCYGNSVPVALEVTSCTHHTLFNGFECLSYWAVR